MSRGGPERPSGGDLVFVGDVHLERDDPHLPDFLDFLDGLRREASRVVFLGDLFNLWIGRGDLEQQHHREVLEALRELRRAGLGVVYVEGNRDYRIARAHARDALDVATDGGVVERFGGLSLFAIHGDLANRRDRQYRTWRRVSRSAPFWLAFNLLPRATRARIADGLETRMRGTNLEYKREFPEAEVRDYAAGYLGQGHDVVVLGHFHEEHRLEAVPPSPPGRIFVLPEWKQSRRHLRVGPDGTVEFVDSRDRAASLSSSPPSRGPGAAGS